uniref:sulfatase-like hydrolase/transferase n=1 Tax=Sphingomonas bacterium TaxID=1895847 RepID=UPI0026397B2E|nr:sulfatase-like hydrolase/transferase [Sphingomonas bacterium]
MTPWPAFRVAGWRGFYLLFLVALLLVQNVGRMVIFFAFFRETRFSAFLHGMILAAILLGIAAIVACLPVRRHGRAIAAPAAALLLGTAHAVSTVFDASQYAMHHYAAMHAPVWLAITDPGLVLALLGSIDVGRWTGFATLAALLALHIALYVPVAPHLAAMARALFAASIPIAPRRRISAMWPVTLYLILLLLLMRFAPGSQWRLEPFHAGLTPAFQMAPSELRYSRPKRDAAPARIMPLAHPRPLILIVVDALRRERMGVYDPTLDTTPFLRELKRRGTLHILPAPYATCTFSACGIMSVLTSRSWDNFGKSPETVPDVLSGYGYRNYLILGGNHSSFAMLMSYYAQHTSLSRDQPTTSQPDDRFVLGVLRDTTFPDPRHSFLYLHLMSAHMGAFVEPPFRPGAPLQSGPAAATRDPAFVRQYDGRVRQSDDMLRRVFALLDSKGLLKNALVVITADHGERLGEQGRYYHGGPPDQSAISIPILVYDASGAAYPDHKLVSQIDIAPTFLRAVGGAPGIGWRGHALQDQARVDAIPLGTVETTGIIAALPGGPYKYLCGRETGREDIRRIDGTAEGSSIAIGLATTGLLPRLRALHRAVAGPINGKCHH